MTHPPFVPVGLPRESSPDDSTDQRVGLHLLEALDSLDAVYKSAAFFAEVASEASIGAYTLTRCLESVHSEAGALLLVQGDALVPHGELGEVLRWLQCDRLVAGELGQRALFHNGADACDPPHRPGAGFDLRRLLRGGRADQGRRMQLRRLQLHRS